MEDMTECIKIIWLMILLMTEPTSVGGSHVFNYIVNMSNRLYYVCLTCFHIALE
jgi:hypothetical protein